nr:hypothetical protein [Mitsuokella sp. AF33-22]
MDGFGIHHCHITGSFGGRSGNIHHCRFCAVFYIEIIRHHLPRFVYRHRLSRCSRLGLGHACPRKRSQSGKYGCRQNGRLPPAAMYALAMRLGKLRYDDIPIPGFTVYNLEHLVHFARSLHKFNSAKRVPLAMRWYYAIIANLDLFLLLSRYFLHSNTKNMSLTSFSFRPEIITLIKKK